MPIPDQPIFRAVLVRVFSVALRRVQKTSQSVSRASLFLEGAALASCTPDELSKLTAACYQHGIGADRRQLFDWERTWFERDLPPAPAHILVGGAGAGREVTWLERQGYQVTAFDPVQSDGSSEVLQARYEDLLMRQGDMARELSSRSPYDAVLLGWGSFTHVANDSRRLQVLQALRGICQGPLLLSYWRGVEGQAVLQSRARALGQKAGNWMMHSQATAPERGDRVTTYCGFAHQFQKDELDALALAAGYVAECYEDIYGHATLRPAHKEVNTL